jgi:hypothetical protein
MSSEEDPLPSKKQRVEMDSDNNQRELLDNETVEMKEDAEAVDISSISLTMKPEAPSLEAFLENPTMYRPKEEFLGASLGEVRSQHFLGTAIFSSFKMTLLMYNVYR